MSANQAASKFAIGDRVVVNANELSFGEVTKCWYSLGQGKHMYEVTLAISNEKQVHEEGQLQLDPIPTTYRLEAKLEHSYVLVALRATRAKSS